MASIQKRVAGGQHSKNLNFRSKLDRVQEAIRITDALPSTINTVTDKLTGH